MSDPCPTLVHLVAQRRRDGSLPKPEKTSDLRFHMVAEDAEAQLASLPADVRASFGVFEAHLTVLGACGDANRIVETPWGLSRQETAVDGFEACLLLHLLQEYLKDVASGARTAVAGFTNLKDLESLRYRLYAAAQEPNADVASRQPLPEGDAK